MRTAIRKWVALASVVGLTSGCSVYALEELRHTTMSGTPFQSELARYYMDFATQEEKVYDWNDSWYFADKGLSLAYGKEAGPEDLANWSIPAAALPALERARADLVAALTADVMRVSPARAAAAQFYFDCWVEQQEESWQEEEIAYCREHFLTAMADLKGGPRKEASAAPKKAAKKAEPKKEAAVEAEEKPAEAPAPKMSKKTEASEEPATPLDAIVAEPKKESKPAATVKTEAKETKKAKDAAAKDAGEVVGNSVETTSYAVFFETNKAEVSEPGMNVITEIIKSLNGTSDYAVLLHTSKDRPGMAAERIHVIRKLLAAGGVKSSAIRVGSGKTEVESGKSPRRRVEIFLNE